jgi:uncharacterized membrane protein
MNTLRRACIVASIAWGLALPLATWLASPRAPESSAGYAFALAIYAAGSLICHQRAERSFHLFGVQMPVCARCAGLYVGAAVAAAFVIARAIYTLAHKPSEVSSRWSIPVPALWTARTVVVASCLPTIATLLYEWITGQMPANAIRALAGVPLGAAAAGIVASADRVVRENK